MKVIISNEILLTYKFILKMYKLCESRIYGSCCTGLHQTVRVPNKEVISLFIFLSSSFSCGFCNFTFSVCSVHTFVSCLSLLVRGSLDRGSCTAVQMLKPSEADLWEVQIKVNLSKKINVVGQRRRPPQAADRNLVSVHLFLAGEAVQQLSGDLDAGHRRQQAAVLISLRGKPLQQRHLQEGGSFYQRHKLYFYFLP